MNPSSRDAGIPVLTEVISPFAENDEQKPAVQHSSKPEPQLESAPALPSAANKVEAFPMPDADAFEIQAASRLSEDDWKRLERRIRERILVQILSKVDAILEQRIRDSLADVLQVALEGLTAQLRDGLHHSLEDVISRAVSQEITRLQMTKK